MSGRDLVLAVDVGTQSVRALAFDRDGNLLARERVPLDPYAPGPPGQAEQDAEVYWNAIGQACRGLLASDAGLRERIAGLALTTQRGTVVCTDAAGRPLRPAIVWLDQRRTRGLPPLGGPWGLALRAARVASTVEYLRAEAESHWIRVHEPDVWARTERFLLLSGWLSWRLVGRCVDSVGCQVGYLPFDYRRLRWARRWDWKWRALPIRPSQLPELIEPTRPLGELTVEAAEATGLPAGLPVIAAAADKACEVLGSGCLEPHLACLSYGTTATINTTHRRYVEAVRLLPPYPSPVPGHHSLEVQVFRGYWMVSWFRDQFGHPEARLAAERGVTPESLFDELLRAVPPGSDGLLLQPYWTPGLRHPGPEARGAIIGFGDVHTRAHLYRAILEGLAYALREGRERMERRTGVAVDELRVAGGGAQSDAALQITADVFGLPAARPHTHEASGLGAAIVAAVGLGLHPDFATAVRTMTRVARVFTPDPAARRVYDQLYTRVYRRMYPRLRPLYDALSEVLGRP
jgi:sugar (pentulose or hexulose) kinase